MSHTTLPLALLLLLSACWAATITSAQPSFDCSVASGEAEEAVCNSPALSDLDVELSRLYELALNGPNVSAESAQLLKEMQRGWIKGRDECWKSDLGLETCIANEYAFRIDEIRTGYADARAQEGASLGPFAYACDGLGALVSAVFINSGAPMVVLRWRDRAVVLPQGPSGSGARYVSDNWGDRPVEFWIKGTAATLNTADGQTLSCIEEETG